MTSRFSAGGAAAVRRFYLLSVFALMLAYAQFRESGLPSLAAHLEITVVDSSTGAAMPARLYLMKGKRPFRFTPVEALLPCVPDSHYRDRLWKIAGRPKTLEVTSHGESHLILLDGRATFDLPQARYRIEAYRGLFFKPAEVDVELKAGENRKLEIKLDPLPGNPHKEWLAADDHIHLIRSRDDNDIFLRWMQAENLAVGNFLQLQRQMDAAFQYGWGREGEARAPGYSIRSGHESRSFYYGHVIVLGPKELQRPVGVSTEFGNSPEAYPPPMVLFQRGQKELGGIPGYAHFDGITGGGNKHSTFPMDLALNTIVFTEVFQFGRLRTEEWYRILNAGFRLTGLAGSDFPVSTGRGVWPRKIPLLGPERALVKAKAGESAYDSWAAGVRRGDVVVSNGPALDFQVNGRSPGTVIEWKGERVSAKGTASAVCFRPIEKIEIVVNGKVVATRAGDGKSTTLSLPFDLAVKESSWIAARTKSPNVEGEPEIWAHTNPVYLHRDGIPTVVRNDRDYLIDRWEKEVTYYRSFGLSFANDQHKQELFRNMDDALAILRAQPKRWKE